MATVPFNKVIELMQAASEELETELKETGKLSDDSVQSLLKLQELVKRTRNMYIYSARNTGRTTLAKSLGLSTARISQIIKEVGNEQVKG